MLNNGGMLLLFDIDGTLLRNASKRHAKALRVALGRVYGVGPESGGPEALPRVEAAGRTDLEIAREIALLCDVPAERFEDLRSELMSAWLREYAGLVEEDLSGRVVEGMADLLSDLAGMENVILSLVTGNLEGIAKVKLHRARLKSFFSPWQGGFGSDSEDRTDLPAIARKRAGALRGGGPYPRERTIVIGDTSRDIACARADGLRCIAVTTGPYGERDLTGADAVAKDVGQLRELLLAQLARMA